MGKSGKYPYQQTPTRAGSLDLEEAETPESASSRNDGISTLETDEEKICMDQPACDSLHLHPAVTNNVRMLLCLLS